MLLSYMRTIILYLVLVAVIRLMGKRQVGQMEPSEFVVTMLIANLASIPMQDGGIPLYSGLVPILTVLGVELILTALSMRFVPFRKLLCGRPVILIENGKILQQNLRSTCVTLDELTELLRMPFWKPTGIFPYSPTQRSAPPALRKPASRSSPGIFLTPL